MGRWHQLQLKWEPIVEAYDTSTNPHRGIGNISIDITNTLTLLLACYRRTGWKELLYKHLLSTTSVPNLINTNKQIKFDLIHQLHISLNHSIFQLHNITKFHLLHFYLTVSLVISLNLQFPPRSISTNKTKWSTRSQFSYISTFPDNTLQLKPFPQPWS